MNADLWRTATLVAATLTTGLTAGLLTSFSIAVMPGLREADDHTFLTTMQATNRRIINPAFLVIFLGAILWTLAAMVLQLASRGPSLPWIVTALALNIGVLAVTRAVHLPLNNRLAAAGPADQMTQAADTRLQFEPRWTRWNTVRALLSTGALGCLPWALVVHGGTGGVLGS